MMSLYRQFAAGLLLTIAFAPAIRSSSAKTATLHNGDSFSATGTIKARYTGWDSRLVVRTASAYFADLSDEGVSRIHEIELEPSFRQLELSKHLGEAVTVKGKLQFGWGSPYYWNGVMLMPTSVTLADGRVLLPVSEPQGRPIPADVHTYVYQVFLVPKTFTRRAEAIDLVTRRHLPTDLAGGCMVSGGGRGGVLNCGCADGFKTTKGGSATHSIPIARLKPFDDPGAAQLLIPEDAIRPLVVEFICVREDKGER